MAIWNILQIIKKHEHDPCDLFFAVIVHDLSHLLDNVKCVVLEVLVGERVIAEDPEHAEHVVGDLVGLEALVVEEVGDHLETKLIV